MLFDGEVKLKAGKLMVPVRITREGSRLFLKFGWNKRLMEEVKEMEDARWHGRDDVNPRKVWSVKDSQRNRFQLSYLAHPGANDPSNPYYWYGLPLTDREPSRKCYEHQRQMFKHGLTRHYCVLAAEMGTGKTLAAIEIIEASGAWDVLWVAPKPALVSARLEWQKWGCRVIPRWVTYDGLKKLVEGWPAGKRPPQLVVFDESSRLKNPTAQRTQAARHLADAVRSEWGFDGYVIEMSGSPAPKDPTDWWSQCEVAQPGFLREGSREKCRRRLAIIETRESFAGGGAYPHLVSWRDDERKCNVCGRLEEEHRSGVDVFSVSSTVHAFERSRNEVDYIHERMRGLVTVHLKRDCLDLPDKIYRIVELKPSRSTLNAASAIAASATSQVVCVTLLRELSDGFQYTETVVGRQVCTLCGGTRVHDQPVAAELTEAEIMAGQAAGVERVSCPMCSGTGEVDRVQRDSVEVPTPKEGALRELLEECEEAGRIVVYGGFTGSIHRICKIVKSAGWSFVKADGQGWTTDLPAATPEAMIRLFQEGQSAHPRVAFVGQPGAAGMGLTLTAAPMTVYYSNDYNAESRIQSEDRIHRPGMDVNRGATIVDLIHLPTDRKVLENLQKKRRLQDISMGELRAVLARAEAEAEEGLERAV